MNKDGNRWLAVTLTASTLGWMMEEKEVGLCFRKGSCLRGPLNEEYVERLPDAMFQSLLQFFVNPDVGLPGGDDFPSATPNTSLLDPNDPLEVRCVVAVERIAEGLAPHGPSELLMYLERQLAATERIFTTLSSDCRAMVETIASNSHRANNDLAARLAAVEAKIQN